MAPGGIIRSEACPLRQRAPSDHPAFRMIVEAQKITIFQSLVPTTVIPIAVTSFRAIAQIFRSAKFNCNLQLTSN
jgi:hypothetical protein